jgi:hypothetical protein
MAVAVLTRARYASGRDHKVMNAGATMAQRGPARHRAGKPEPGPRKRAVLQMKGTEEWKEWLDELARFLRMPIAAVVDNALVWYAKERGFTKEAPER